MDLHIHEARVLEMVRPLWEAETIARHPDRGNPCVTISKSHFAMSNVDITLYRETGSKIYFEIKLLFFILQLRIYEMFRCDVK